LKNYAWILEHTECQVKNPVRNKGQSDKEQGVIGDKSNNNNDNFKVIHPSHAVDQMYMFTNIVIHISVNIHIFERQ
jgi:hypothetical protein